MEETILKEKGLRVTPFREKFLQIFLNSNVALSVSDIENQLGEFDRITLYRTIKSFTKKGVIHEIVMPGDIKKLALCPVECSGGKDHHEHNHIHFHCKNCKEIYCIETNQLPQLNLKGYAIDQVEVQVSGTCLNCQSA
jgi:Fur family ferric uptake transcriptional regulator